MMIACMAHFRHENNRTAPRTRLKQHLDGALFLLWFGGRHAEQRAQLVLDGLGDAAFERAVDAIAVGRGELGGLRGGLWWWEWGVRTRR
jgi:hypothetical protein